MYPSFSLRELGRTRKFELSTWVATTENPDPGVQRLGTLKAISELWFLYLAHDTDQSADWMKSRMYPKPREIIFSSQKIFTRPVIRFVQLLTLT